MLRVGQYNQFANPDKLLTLKRGEYKVFKLIDEFLKKDPDHPNQDMIPTICPRRTMEIFDPTVKAVNDIQPVVRAAFIIGEGQGDNKTPILGQIWFDSKNKGILPLNGDNPIHVHLYHFLQVSDENATNPHRNVSVKALFEEVMPVVKAKEKNAIRVTRKAAMDILDTMKNDEVKQFALALSWPATEDVEVIKDQLGQLADDNPQEFLDRWKDRYKDMKASIKEGLDQNIIKFDVSQRSYTWEADGQLIYKSELPIKPGQEVNQLCDFITNSSNGSKITILLAKRLEGKKMLESGNVK